MDLNPHPDDILLTPVSFYLLLSGIRIRVYFLSSIDFGYFHPDMLDQLRFYHPVSYPYAWYVYEDQAVIVDFNDLLQAYEQQTHQQSSSYRYSETIDEVAIINESFEQASEFMAYSGLTKKEISKNLRVMKYREEESEEVCVVCQVEFAKNERVGVLECRHRFHPKCIEEWLIWKNVCPLCKDQALKV